ncbi:MAG: tetratricopeptide repeat protein [Ignavibacteria bacterium]|nr:tetratricopeptide repeat protein [Ignavibacteria bacterium]
MKLKIITVLLVISAFFISGCTHMSHRTYTKTEVAVDEDPEPVYEITLDENYQNFVEYMFAVNRSESFGTYFNKYYMAEVDFDEGMKEYRAGYVANYNPSLDSLDKVPPVATAAKEKFNLVIERCSKIIQYNKNTRFLDDAVLLIGKSYFFMQDYLQAERKFNEFLSKLTRSELYDEAILYLGKTKMKLRNKSDGELILNNLLVKTDDNEIKSEITEELAINSLSNRDIKTAVEYFEKSVDFTKDDEKKANKQYTLAKIFLLSDIEKSVSEYDKVIDNTSDFDLTFYAKLNKGVALIKLKKYKDARKLFRDLSKDYRDYPDLKQQADLEHANTYFYLGEYDEALTMYYDLIIEFAGTKSASEAYYYMGKYYEEIKNDYFNALINYKKSAQGPISELVSISIKKYNHLDKYFTLIAEIQDTLKTDIPGENPQLEKYKQLKLEEEGIEQEKGKQEPKFEQQHEGKGFGSGVRDTTDADTLKTEIKDEIGDGGDTEIIKEQVKDTVVTDTSGINNYEEIIDLQHIEDSINAARQDKIFNAYFNMAELFAFSMGINDSAIVYLEFLMTDDTSSYRKPRAMYMLSTLYRSEKQEEKANKLLNDLIEQFPKTELANEARKILGLELIEIETDPAEYLYKEAVDYIYSGNYQTAIGNLTNVFTNYTQSKVAPKSLFTLGWIYEHHLANKDSAYYYYKFLKDRYPFSRYSIAVDPKLNVLTDFFNPKIQDTTGVLPDSLKEGEDIIGELPQEKEKELFDISEDSLKLDPELLKQIMQDTLLTVPLPEIQEEQPGEQEEEAGER